LEYGIGLLLNLQCERPLHRAISHQDRLVPFAATKLPNPAQQAQGGSGVTGAEGENGNHDTIQQ
jgi:hypothetical protein